MSSLILLVLSIVLLASANPTPTRCFICEQIVQFALINPQFANDTEKLIDKFCVVLPSKEAKICENIAAKIGNIFTLISQGLGREADSALAVCAMMNDCTQQCCLTSNAPEQVHISFIGDTHTQMGITWTTLNNLPTIVQYGVIPSKLTLSTTGKSSTFTGGGWTGFMHYVQLGGLNPGTTYFYRVGDGNTWSKIFSFKTEPSPNNNIIRVANVGDMGNVNSAGNMKQLQQLVQNNQIDFIIHNGDISYADGDQAKWDRFFRSMENITAFVPYMATPGNHEIGVIGALGLALGYINRFQLPGHGISSDLENMYYSWEYGPAHFISLDTESILDVALITKEQVDWLAKDLASIDRKKTPWIIAFGHRPLYCSNGGSDCDTEANVLKQAVEQLFNTYKVDLVLMAHKHRYERFWPTKIGGNPIKTYNNPNAPVYVLNGAGGNREGLEKQHDALNNSVTFISRWGYGLITIYNSTVLEWKFVDSDSNLVLDSFVLQVNH